VADIVNDFLAAIQSNPQASQEFSRLKDKAMLYGGGAAAMGAGSMVPEPVVNTGRTAVEGVNQMADDFGRNTIDPMLNQMLPQGMDVNVNTGVSPMAAVRGLLSQGGMPPVNPSANISYQAPGGGLYGSGTVTPQGMANPTVGYSTPVLGGAGSFDASVSSSGPVSKFPSSSDLFAAARLNLKF
jgi:hypothetical protein